MNKYGAQARAHWVKHLPKSYGQIADAESFFTQLGEEIEDRVEELSQAIAGDDPAGEGYLQKVGRLNEARAAAESDVFKEMLPEPENA